MVIEVRIDITVALVWFPGVTPRVFDLYGKHSMHSPFIGITYYFHYCCYICRCVHILYACVPLLVSHILMVVCVNQVY